MSPVFRIVAWALVSAVAWRAAPASAGTVDPLSERLQTARDRAVATRSDAHATTLALWIVPARLDPQAPHIRWIAAPRRDTPP